MGGAQNVLIIGKNAKKKVSIIQMNEGSCSGPGVG